MKFANDLLSHIPCDPEPLLGFVLITTESFANCPTARPPWQPLQSFMVHNASNVPSSSIGAAVAMRHSVSVRRDLCQTFSLAAARESGALCTTRACHLPRELSFDFGFLSKYGA